VFIGKSASKHPSFTLLRISAVLAVSGLINAAFGGNATEMPGLDDPQTSSPRPIKPPHKPVQHGTQLALFIGFNFFTYGQYGYNTAITMPNGATLNYSGKQSAPGGTLLVGAAIRPPSALRRFTLGFTLNAGGLNAWSNPVIPSGAQTPFSQGNLNAQLRRSAALRYGWSPAISPYVEHDLGFLSASRIRAGYQYWHQSGSYQGSFPTEPSRSSPSAEYNVRLSHSSHLIRLSINNQMSFEDDDDPTSTATSAKRTFGFVRQAGLLVGTNQTVMVFVGFGPAWSF
jgi:hypothetical protein